MSVYGSSEARSTRYSAVPTSEGAESSKLVEEATLEKSRQYQWCTWAVVALLATVAFSAYTLWAGPNHKPATSSSTSDSAAPSTPDDIYGGGWTVVRCVSSIEGTWHPATDNLYGTESYGTYANSYTTDTTFSTTWSPSDYSTVLLGLTDLSAWVVADTSQLFVLGSPVDATIIESSTSSTSYTAEWINRPTEEDPWCSVYGHYEDDPGMVYGENSKTGHMEHLGIGGVGACVWLK